MLTFPQIIKRAEPARVANARFVRLVSYKTGYTQEGFAYAACRSYSTHVIGPDGRRVRNPNRERHTTVVLFLDKKLHVNLSCSCGDFTYRWETALHHHGAADIEYSNGEMPNSTNPYLSPQCCKHLVALYERIKPHLRR